MSRHRRPPRSTRVGEGILSCKNFIETRVSICWTYDCPSLRLKRVDISLTRRNPMSTTRILCLHGYHGSAAILRRQMSPVAAALSADVELVYIDAPSLASGDFGWWHEGFRGWERTRDWMIELVGVQRYDGVFGFSQGAALAGLLVALGETEQAPL